MVKFERELRGDFEQILQRMEKGILQSNRSVSLEEESDFQEGGARCSVRVFERYSHIGRIPLSLTLVLFQAGDVIRLSVYSAGSCEGLFFNALFLAETILL